MLQGISLRAIGPRWSLGVPLSRDDAIGFHALYPLGFTKLALIDVHGMPPLTLLGGASIERAPYVVGSDQFLGRLISVRHGATF